MARKRSLPDYDICSENNTQPAKVRRLDAYAVEHYPPRVNNSHRIPNEIMLHVLSFLSLKDVLTCERVSKRFGVLARDSSLWKYLYVERFIRNRSRSSDLVNCKEKNRRRVLHGIPRKSNRDSSHIKAKDWKSQYKVRHKWATGSCTFREIILAGEGNGSRVLLCVHGGIAITVQEPEIRAWTVKDQEQSLLAVDRFSQGYAARAKSRPTAVAIATHNSTSQSITFAVGFANGYLHLYSFNIDARQFRIFGSFQAFDNSQVIAINIACPYAFSMSDDNCVAVHDIGSTLGPDNVETRPKHLSYLSSNTAGEPLSLTSRRFRENTIVSIAYASPSYLSGWTLGLQELELNTQGMLVHSRIATSQTSSLQNSLSSSSEIIRSRGTLYHDTSANLRKPSAITYAHPYLLATHADNTLSFHLVRSTEARLSMSSGCRLWGHTASISAAYIGERGKTVTVARGSDIRVWELEEAFNPRGSNVASVRLQPEMARDMSSDSCKGYPPSQVLPPDCTQSMASKCETRLSGARPTQGLSMVFDEERLVVLQDTSSTSRSFLVYDFT